MIQLRSNQSEIISLANDIVNRLTNPFAYFSFLVGAVQWSIHLENHIGVDLFVAFAILDSKCVGYARNSFDKSTRNFKLSSLILWLSIALYSTLDS